MKGKGCITFIIAAALAAGLAVSAIAAEPAGAEPAGTELGAMTEMVDRAEPEGEDAVVISHIKGMTDSQGCLAIPMYQDAELVSVRAGEGTLVGEPRQQRSGMTSYLVADFREADSRVELTLNWRQEGTYRMKAAKTSGTAPGSLKAVTYTMVNTAPVSVGSYRLELAVPEGYELAGIVGYDPEEAYDIFTEEGVKYGAHVFGEVPVGQECTMTVNIKKAGGSLALFMWAATILISAFFLYKNRGMLKEAGELAGRKKTEKHGGNS